MTAKKTSSKAKAPATQAATKPAAKAPEAKAPEATATTAQQKAKRGKAQAAPVQAAPVATTTEATTAEPKTKGVLGGCKSRAYLAGKLLAATGLGIGVSPELVAKVDELYGKANPTQTGFDCRAAWHAINGYLEALQEMKAK